MQNLSRTEVAAVIAALALLVVGVSLAAVPPAVSAPRTAVEAVTTSPLASPLPPMASPTPVSSPSPLPPSPPSAPSPAPAAPAPIALTGPDHLQPWQTGVYRITFTGSGWRNVSIWWSGAPMANWDFQMISGHEELAAGQDRLTGPVEDTTVIELDLVPTGWPGGQLVIQGQEAGGSALGLAVVQVANHS